ncbi:MAG TPA: hypothetical protein VK968_17995, partial [Roseimicrobium sp.]|nr:hypothetical protein [Roseimicrobium sp.]
MRLSPWIVIVAVALSYWPVSGRSQTPPPFVPTSPPVLGGTKPMTLTGDISAQMVAGIDRYLLRALDRSVASRPVQWQRNFTSRQAYEESVRLNRDHLRKIIGAVDDRLPVHSLDYVTTTLVSAKCVETDRFTGYAVRWQIFEGVYGEGILLHPKEKPVARVIVLPDADQTPEMVIGMTPGMVPDDQYARRLAENGCQVLVMTLIDRQDTWSGNKQAERVTNQPHREWIYRQAFEMGRHIIGYEVQKVLGAIDWMAEQKEPSNLP